MLFDKTYIEHFINRYFFTFKLNQYSMLCTISVQALICTECVQLNSLLVVTVRQCSTMIYLFIFFFICLQSYSYN